MMILTGKKDCDHPLLSQFRPVLGWDHNLCGRIIPAALYPHV